MNNEEKPRTRAGIVLVIAVVFMIFILGQCTGGGMRDSNGRDKTWAIVAAQHTASSKLKSPSSAKFSWSPDVSLVSDTWRVSGTGTAKNAFGVEMQFSYSVSLKSLPNSNGYSVISCTVR